MRIMCVDDEELILRMTVSLCEDLPQTDDVVGFTDPREALEWLEDGQSVDLALLDIDMPDMDGLILATKIKEIWPDTAIIFLTGYSEFAVQAFAIHADGYLLKPIRDNNRLMVLGCNPVFLKEAASQLRKRKS